MVTVRYIPPPDVPGSQMEWIEAAMPRGEPVNPIRFLAGGRPGAAPAVLRPLRQPMYDSEYFDMTRIQFFVDCMRFRDGTQKTHADTNMSQCGQLGNPLSYDMTGIVVAPPRDPDAVRVFDGSSMTWIFGQNVQWYRGALKLMRPYLGLSKAFGLTISPNELYPLYGVDMSIPGTRLARRIDSTDAFRGEMESNERHLKRQKWMMAMMGVLYCHV